MFGSWGSEIQGVGQGGEGSGEHKGYNADGRRWGLRRSH